MGELLSGNGAFILHNFFPYDVKLQDNLEMPGKGERDRFFKITSMTWTL